MTTFDERPGALGTDTSPVRSPCGAFVPILCRIRPLLAIMAKTTAFQVANLAERQHRATARYDYFVLDIGTGGVQPRSTAVQPHEVV